MATMSGPTNGNGSTISPKPDYYNSGNVEATQDSALVIKRLEAVSFRLLDARCYMRFDAMRCDLN